VGEKKEKGSTNRGGGGKRKDGQWDVNEPLVGCEKRGDRQRKKTEGENERIATKKKSKSACGSLREDYEKELNPQTGRTSKKGGSVGRNGCGGLTGRVKLERKQSAPQIQPHKRK